MRGSSRSESVVTHHCRSAQVQRGQNVRRSRRAGQCDVPAVAPRRRLTRPRRGGALRRVAAAGLVGAVGVAVSASGIAEGKTGVRAGAAQVEKAPTLAQAKGARGTVTMCGGGTDPALVRGFNRRYKDQQLKLRVVDFPEEADRYEELSRRLRQRSRGCDFFAMDLDFIGEFAASQWLLDVTPSSGPGKPSSLRRRSRRRGTAGGTWRAAYGRHRIAVLPDGQDRDRAGHVAGGVRLRARQRRHRLSGSSRTRA